MGPGVERLLLARLLLRLDDQPAEAPVCAAVRVHLDRLAIRQHHGAVGDLDEAQAEFGVFTINEKTRDGLKELMRCAAEKGALACTIGTDELLDLFGLAED